MGAGVQVRPVLVLLDFNGTLVYRDKKQEIRTVKPDYVTGHRWAADWHCYCRLEQAGGHRQAGVA